MVPASTVRAVLAGFDALGLDAVALAREAGVPPEPSHDPFAVLDDGAFGRLWAAAFAADGRPHLPALVGVAVPFGAFGLTDHLVGTAPTLEAGLRALAAYFRLVSPASCLVVDAGWVWMESATGAEAPWVADAFTLAVIASRFRPQLLDGRPVEVHLTASVEMPAAPFEAAFRAPVQLGRPRSGLSLPADAWSRSLLRPDPALHATLAALADRADVRAYAATPVAYAVRLRLPAALREGAAGVEAMARELHLSLRTFQRRLAAEGVRYDRLVDRYRREEAVRLLGAGVPVGEVAARLGYTEPTSFSRAFRRWYGAAPSRWSAQG